MQWARNSPGTGHGTGALATAQGHCPPGSTQNRELALCWINPPGDGSEPLRALLCPADVELLCQHWGAPPEGLEPPACSLWAHDQLGAAPQTSSRRQLCSASRSCGRNQLKLSPRVTTCPGQAAEPVCPPLSKAAAPLQCLGQCSPLQAAPPVLQQPLLELGAAEQQDL